MAAERPSVLPEVLDSALEGIELKEGPLTQRPRRGGSQGNLVDGMSLRAWARAYSKKNANDSEQHVAHYTVTKTVADPLCRERHLVPYKNQSTKHRVEYMRGIVAHAKAIPNPQKYSKIQQWGAGDGKHSSMERAKRASIYAQVAKASKQVPGPAHYPRAGPVKDKYCLPRTDVGVSKS